MDSRAQVDMGGLCQRLSPGDRPCGAGEHGKVSENILRLLPFTTGGYGGEEVFLAGGYATPFYYLIPNWCRTAALTTR